MNHDDFEQWAEERRRRLAERRARRARPATDGAGPEARAEGPDRPGAQSGPDGDEADAGASRFGRKEKVLHTRISEALDAALRRASEEMRVPVSNLVRNVLEDVFTVVGAVASTVEGLVDDVVEETADVRERVFGRRRTRAHEQGQGQRRRAQPHTSPPVDDDDLGADPGAREFADVVGWQSLLLNAPQTCADCEEPLPKGTRAFLGIPVSGPPRTYLCRDCMRARSDADAPDAV